MKLFNFFSSPRGRCSGLVTLSCTCDHLPPEYDTQTCSKCGHSNRLHRKPEQSTSTMDRLTCPRADTVTKLAEIIDSEWLVHVRGTPASGKTTLADLLNDHYRAAGERSILVTGWPLSWGKDYRTVFVENAHSAGYLDITTENLKKANLVVILDEGQLTYSDTTLWLEFVKGQNHRQFGPRLCVLTSYGSPTTGPEEVEYGSPLSFLSVTQRVSITVSRIQDAPDVALFYTREEFNDVIDRLCQNPHGKIPLDPATREHIWHLSKGHPGSVNGLTNMAFKGYRSSLKHGNMRSIGPDDFIALLQDEEKSFAFLAQTAVWRSFVNTRGLTVEAADTLRLVLASGSIDRNLDDPGIRLCYTSGWLHAEALDFKGSRIVCVIPSPLHARFIEHYILGESASFPFDRYPTLGSLVKDVIRNFSLRAISAPRKLGTGATVRHLEAQYQDEFYAAVCRVLRFSVKMTSEWGGDATGRIDFRITEPKWGVEILREGDPLRLVEHLDRFGQDGKYGKWIEQGWVSDWLVLDCRTSMPRPLDKPNKKLWRVVFRMDMSCVEILGSQNEEIMPPYPLNG